MRLHRRPSGLTLIEVILVVAVMLLIASLASPTLLGMMESQKLRKSADMVRAELARTRLRAMKEGRIQMFRFQRGAGGYIAQPWFAAEDSLNANDPQTGFAGQVPLSQDIVVEEKSDELPDGVFFVAGETLSDERSLGIDQELQQEQAYEQVWSNPILFYPDGSTSDAMIALANKKSQVIEITLRGITGMSQVSELTRLEGVSP